MISAAKVFRTDVLFSCCISSSCTVLSLPTDEKIAATLFISLAVEGLTQLRKMYFNVILSSYSGLYNRWLHPLLHECTVSLSNLHAYPVVTYLPS